jgi:hypothetical protein
VRGANVSMLREEEKYYRREREGGVDNMYLLTYLGYLFRCLERAI